MKHMLRYAGITIGVLSFNLQAEVFPVEFQKIGKRPPAEAMAGYAELAETTANPVQKDAARFAALEKAILLKKYEDAEKHLGLLKDGQLRILGKMELQYARKQRRELLNDTGEIQFETWRDALIPRAAYLRAYCNAWMKNTEAAEKDIALAIASTNDPQTKYGTIYSCSSLYAQ